MNFSAHPRRVIDPLIDPYAYDVTEGRPPRVEGQIRHCHVRHRQAWSQRDNPCMPYRRAGPGPRTDWEAESANALPAQHVRAARQVLTPNMASLLWRRDVNA